MERNGEDSNEKWRRKIYISNESEVRREENEMYICNGREMRRESQPI